MTNVFLLSSHLVFQVSHHCARSVAEEEERERDKNLDVDLMAAMTMMTRTRTD